MESTRNETLYLSIGSVQDGQLQGKAFPTLLLNMEWSSLGWERKSVSFQSLASLLPIKVPVVVRGFVMCMPVHWYLGQDHYTQFDIGDPNRGEMATILNLCSLELDLNQQSRSGRLYVPLSSPELSSPKLISVSGIFISVWNWSYVTGKMGTSEPDSICLTFHCQRLKSGKLQDSQLG